MTETSTDVYLGTKSTSTDVFYLGTKSTSTEACKSPRGAQGLHRGMQGPRRGPRASPPAPALQMSTWELEREVRQPELEALTERQLKRRQNKDSKLAKIFKNLEAENDNLKSQMEKLEDKITKASKSANARFKRKKIRSMKREADKIAEKLRKSEQALKLLEPRIPKNPISGTPLK